MEMDYESISQWLREMESRYKNGFSSLDRSFLDSLYFKLYGRAITNTGCSNCYRDAYIEICTKLKREKKMSKKSDFQLKAGAVITFFGSSQAYTNANLTNEVAIRYLSLNPSNEKMFSVLPNDWENRVANFSKLGTTDNAGETSDKAIEERDAKIAELEATIETLNVEKASAETERDNLREELAEANKSLEKALAEIDQLNSAKTASRSKKSKAQSSGEEPASTESTAPTESTEQSLDLGA